MFLKIKELFPEIDYSTETKERFTKISFPISGGSDYRFNIYIYEEDGLEIGAELNSSWKEKYPEHNHFWYMPFEAPNFDSKEKMIANFQKTLSVLLTHDTRIIQKKGMVFWDFSCEYLDNKEWLYVSGGSALKKWCKVPDIGQREQIFYGKALITSG